MTSSNWALPNTAPLANNFDYVDQQYRNSFYWSPLQYPGLSGSGPNSLTSTDYKLGQLRHWLLADASDPQASEVLSIERDPGPATNVEGQVTYYDYTGK